MTWLVAGKSVRSILLTRLRYLGDVAMSTVVMEVLKAGDPQLQIGYLSEARHGVVLRHHPHLTRLHLLDIKRHGADARARTVPNADPAVPTTKTCSTWGMVRELRRARYDVAVDLLFNPRSAWLLWLSGIRVRLGGPCGSRRRLYTAVTALDDLQELAPQLADLATGGLAEHMCRLAPLHHAESGLSFVEWTLREFGKGPLRPRLVASRPLREKEPYLVLAPGATWAAKEWPEGHWSALITRLIGGAGPRLKVLVPPGAEAMWCGLGRSQGNRRLEILPPTPLPAVMDLLAGAVGLLAVDGGVMHLAVALGVPTLALFGPTDPAIWFPYERMGPYRVLCEAPACHPCDRHECAEFICLPGLAVDKVEAAARSLFSDAFGGNDRLGGNL